MDLLQGLRCTFRQSVGWLQGPPGLMSRMAFLLEDACARGQTDDETSQHQTRRDEGWEERERRGHLEKVFHRTCHPLGGGRWRVAALYSLSRDSMFLENYVGSSARTSLGWPL